MHVTTSELLATIVRWVVCMCARDAYDSSSVKIVPSLLSGDAQAELLPIL
jgi:hypothetical protein